MLTKNTDQLKQRVAEHVAADSIIQGIYWDKGSKRGCFIGCLAKRDDPSLNEATYGLPVMVQRIAENIFEGLTPDEAKEFFAAFPDAVECDNKDLSVVGWQFLAAELRALPGQFSEIQAVIDPVITGMDLLANGQPWPDAWAAADAARDVGDNTAQAAPYAARWASGAAAADAVGDAAVQAAAAARAATRAAAQAAGRAARLRQRDLLLRLISESPVVEQLDD